MGFQIVTVEGEVGILTEPLHQVASSVRRNCWEDDIVFSEYRIDVVALEDSMKTQPCAKLTLFLRLRTTVGLQDMAFTADLSLLDSNGFDAWLKVASQSFCRPTTKRGAAIQFLLSVRMKMAESKSVYRNRALFENLLQVTIWVRIPGERCDRLMHTEESRDPAWWTFKA